MTPLDRILQRWRIRRAIVHLPRRSRVLDIGADDGILLRETCAVDSVGIDPNVPHDSTHEFGRMIRGSFPDDLPNHKPFDAIALLAVLEHIPRESQDSFAGACARHLAPGGRLVLTVPSPHVDRILSLLMALRLVDGMSVDQHFGYDVRETRGLFERAGLRLIRHERFQLGLNNLFVFERPNGSA
jgi:SAM-dependent methyltransferase